MATGTISACSCLPKPTVKKAIHDKKRADAEQAGGDQLGIARADLRPEQAGDQEAEQRKEDDEVVEHARLSPSAR